MLEDIALNVSIIYIQNKWIHEFFNEDPIEGGISSDTKLKITVCSGGLYEVPRRKTTCALEVFSQVNLKFVEASLL
jgi:hypothetical protein